MIVTKSVVPIKFFGILLLLKLIMRCGKVGLRLRYVDTYSAQSNGSTWRESYFILNQQNNSKKWKYQAKML